MANPNPGWARLKRERRAYYDKLNEILDRIFVRMDERGLTRADLSRKSGVGYGTIHNLWHWRTLYPRFATVHALAKAVGFDLELKVVVAKRRSA